MMKWLGCVGLIGHLLLVQCAPTQPVGAPCRTAAVVDQLAIAGNACGPAALLNALRHGSLPYQQAARAIPGDTDTKQLRDIILHQGSCRSNHGSRRPRWSRRGIHAADLTDVANDIVAPHGAPRLQLWIPVAVSSKHALHRKIVRSLRAGFPPILALRRYAGIEVVGSHYVTLCEIRLLDGEDEAWSVEYLDPLGGKKCHGIIRAYKTAGPWRYLADFPETPVGLKRARGASQLRLDSVILCP